MPTLGKTWRWKTHRSLEERFWKRVQIGPGCWLWIGSRTKKGYGSIRAPWHGPLLLAHRVSYELHFGPIPPGKYICHHCDNPPCVRPDHFFLGDESLNKLDMHRKGRARGYQRGFQPGGSQRA
jgi:hypothetical protein